MVSQLMLSGFFRRLATMLQAGIPIHEAVDFNSGNGDERRLDEAASAVVKRLETGWQLSQAMAEHRDVFPVLTIHLVKAGEESGMLSQVMDQLASHLERSVNLRRKMRAAFTYPAMLLVLTFVIVAVLGAFVFPQEKAMLESLGAELPLITKIMLFVMDTFFSPTAVGLVVLVALVFTATWPFFGRPVYDYHLRKSVDTWILRVPVIGPVLYRASAARMLSGLSTLLSSGLAVTQALKLTAELASNTYLRDQVKESRSLMLEGEGLYRSLAKCRVFQPMVLQIFRVGEEQGRLDELTHRMASMLEEDVENSLEVMAALLEPVAMMIMGGVIGFVVLASALPTMNLVAQL